MRPSGQITWGVAKWNVNQEVHGSTLRSFVLKSNSQGTEINPQEEPAQRLRLWWCTGFVHDNELSGMPV